MKILNPVLSDDQLNQLYVLAMSVGYSGRKRDLIHALHYWLISKDIYIHICEPNNGLDSWFTCYGSVVKMNSCKLDNESIIYDTPNKDKVFNEYDLCLYSLEMDALELLKSHMDEDIVKRFSIM